MITRCYFCGGTLAYRIVTAENWWGSDLALVEGVPGWVCDICGEVYFDAETSLRLDELRRSPPAKQRILEVPVFAFSGPRRRSA
ncbi:MAG: type II toxin-antitoxin system MqsA family antitoxin [Dehalococcoidia bacterium]|nr:type II toxin-antitoxin system MqsA family antitoxin [Dehalococcoidia bacterium]